MIKPSRYKNIDKLKLQPDVMFMSEKNWKEILEWSKKEKGKYGGVSESGLW